MKNPFRTALLDRTMTFGAWMQIGHPAPAEIFGSLGYDWVCVDLEHGAVDIESLTNIFRTLDAYGSVPVARLPYADPIWIKRSLDAGARGLVIPMVNSGQTARDAMRQAKYPPLGERGYGYSRANLHGLDFAESIKQANDEIAIVMQIEHRDGIADIDAILETPGVDGAFIWPLDLSGSYGKTGELDCPEMRHALSRFRAACASHRKAAGMHIVHPVSGNIQETVADGYTMIALGLDNVFLSTAAEQALRDARTMKTLAGVEDMMNLTNGDR